MFHVFDPLDCFKDLDRVECVVSFCIDGEKINWVVSWVTKKPSLVSFIRKNDNLYSNPAGPSCVGQQQTKI